MITIGTEQVVTLKDACALLPRRRRGKKPSVATLYRWATTGVRGVRLESIMVGGTRCTSIEAIQRFFDRLTEQRDQGRVTTHPEAPGPATRRREIGVAKQPPAQAGAK